MMFAVIMLVNLLVAMFATTYSECTEQAELIWKFKRYSRFLWLDINFYVRYELVMDFYNNPAKPCTPPLTLIWDIYWLIKKILLQVIPITTALSTKKESLSRTFNSVRFQIFKRKF